MIITLLKGDGKYENVRSRGFTEPRKENKREAFSVEDLDLHVEWERVRRLEDPDFLTQIVLMAPMALADQRTKKYQPKHAEAWKLKYADGWTKDHLSDEFNVAKATFSNNYEQGGWCAIFNREVAGYAAEYALQHRYYPDCEVYGKNIPEAPDLLNKETGLMVEVKLRHRADPPKPANVQPIRDSEPHRRQTDPSSSHYVQAQALSDRDLRAPPPVQSL